MVISPLIVSVVEVSIVNVPATIARSDDAMVVLVDNVPPLTLMPFLITEDAILSAVTEASSGSMVPVAGSRSRM